MAGKIPRTFIDDLLVKLDIVELIDSRVKLKKQGKDYSTCCPFHNERTPSFTVSQEKQFYHCFGCGVHGNAIDFVMEFDRLEFVEAIEELSSQLGLDVPRNQTCGGIPRSSYTPNDQKRGLYQMMGEIARFYQRTLRTDIGYVAIDYLKGRGLSGKIVQQFGIGYVADVWNQVRTRFGKDNKSQQTLISIGMLIENDNGQRYDRFRGRIMFPIRDRRGRVVGFGGRVLGNGTPKYLNSPEMPIFHKGRELYGLYEALQAHRKPKLLIIVEGYMDVVALAQFGIDYAVASLGTSTTAEHIQILFRQTSSVVCCYDGDHAGRDAAWRTMEQALSHLKDGCQLKFMFLPEGEDPDSMIREIGKDAFEVELAAAMSLSEFMYSTLIEQVDTSSLEGKAKLTTLTVPLIEKIPGGTLRLYLRNILGQKLGLPNEQQLEKLINLQGKLKARKTLPEMKRTPMREVITLLLQNPRFAESVPPLDGLDKLAIPGLILFTTMLELCRQRPNIATGQLIEFWRGTDQNALLGKLAIWMLPITENNALEVFLDSLDKILTQCVQQQIAKLQAKSNNVGLSVEEKQELQLLILNRLG
ncbi:DNA primase [Candidatus Enterovibrio escicola]|uniref:DNA primase n=2 Tax=Candidatus Enterovibrio escicola TaxID=1927127 RepID=A0A2A5T3K4_9GAMM|nr:DNA primase [Candidatus Enterovibrio escacola]PCS22736.1 DNA primase [Candidatus Enterovibrio escacola]